MKWRVLVRIWGPVMSARIRTEAKDVFRGFVTEFTYKFNVYRKIVR